jgi:hypothetical protein
MGILKLRWKAPSPAFFKKVIKIAITLSAAAVTALGGEALGKTVLPGFTWTLLPWASIMWKNLLVAGLAAAAVAKLTKEDGYQLEEPAGKTGPGGSQNPPTGGLPIKP